MNEILQVSLRTIVALIILFIIFKIMGKKQVSGMNLFDYIIGITIGSIVADIALDIQKNFLSGVISLIILCLADIFISYLNLKSINLRNIFEGKEATLIENGKINSEIMAKNKITINMLQTEARVMGYFNLDEINNAILEPNGKISFELKEKAKPVTKKDIGLNSKDKPLVYNLIIDGEIIEENLNHANKTKKWLNHELKVLGKKQEELILLTIDANEKINIYPKK